MNDLEEAVGQFVVYRAVMARTEPDHVLYLAVPQEIIKEVFQEPLGQLLLESVSVRVIGFDPVEERITTWMP
jgi:hypothetical protein